MQICGVCIRSITRFIRAITNGAGFPVAADMFNGCLTDTLKSILRDDVHSEDVVNERFMLLTQPVTKSLIQQEQEEFLALVACIQKDPYHRKLFSSLYTAFEERHAAPLGLATHTPEYERLLEKKIGRTKESIRPAVSKKSTRTTGTILRQTYVDRKGRCSRVTTTFARLSLGWAGADAKKEPLTGAGRVGVNGQKRTALIRKLKLNTTHRALFDAFGDFMVTKIYRRYAQIYAIYRIQPLLAEIARRTHLTLMQVRFLLKVEVRVAPERNARPRGPREAYAVLRVLHREGGSV